MREERGHYFARFGGATVWGEIDGYKQQITAFREIKKGDRDSRENRTPPILGCAPQPRLIQMLQLAVEAITGL